MVDSYIKQYGKRLYGLCLKLCTDRFEADDLYQDTWLKVMKNIGQYDPSKSFEPWLTQICVNTYRNGLRRLVRNPFFNRFATTEEKDQAMEKHTVPQKEEFVYIHDAINKLPEKLRMTVILYYFEEMEISKVAAVLNIPPGTVKSRLSKSRKLLREVLKNETDIQF